jgi:protease I
MAELHNMKVAVLATDGVEEVELTEPVKALKDAGARVEIINHKKMPIQAFRHHDKGAMIGVDHSIDEVDPNDYDALLLPGGTLNADRMRRDPSVIHFIQVFDKENKPIAAICHAAWELVSAGIAQGRKLTSYESIQDDLRNAGAEWIDREVVVDGNLVTSRKPADIPAFNREMIKLFSQQPLRTT